jgi:hypothetical protein
VQLGSLGVDLMAAQASHLGFAALNHFARHPINVAITGIQRPVVGLAEIRFMNSG